VAEAPTIQSSPQKKSVPELDKGGERVKRMFAQIASRYDLLNHLLSAQVDRYWRYRTVGWLRLSDAAPVLDVCTGTGDLAFAIHRRWHPKLQVSVVGSDFCQPMLNVARRKNEKWHAGLAPRSASAAPRSENLPTSIPQFINADTQSIPFDDDTFQAVTVAFGLRNVSDTDQGLREMIRVCRPGGQVVVLEFSKPWLPGLRQFYGFYFRSVLPRIGQWLAKNQDSAYEYLPASVAQFPCGQALADRMTCAGLTDVRFRPLTGGIATFYEGTKPMQNIASREETAGSR
jgi:demethylmenaquinone methyltransferase / 2-methoxy-6-polyprenyl-1,4-benzoquinol methylase